MFVAYALFIDHPVLHNKKCGACISGTEYAFQTPALPVPAGPEAVWQETYCTPFQAAPLQPTNFPESTQFNTGLPCLATFSWGVVTVLLYVFFFFFFGIEETIAMGISNQKVSSLFKKVCSPIFFVYGINAPLATRLFKYYISAMR